MASPKTKRQETLAQPIKPLVAKKEITDTLRRWHKEISRLKPVRFAYYPNFQAEEVLSLPIKVGEILAAEQLITLDGTPIATNAKKLADPVFKNHLEIKIFLTLADTAIHSNYKNVLYPVSQMKEFRHLKLLDHWDLGSSLILDELSREGAIAFTVEYLGHRLIGQKLPSLPKLELVNQAVKEGIGRYISTNLTTWSQFMEHFLRPISPVKNESKQKIIAATANIISQKIPQTEPIILPFTVAVSPETFPGINLNYPD